MRVPTHTANDNRRQQAQHFAPHIPGVYEPAKDGLARRERGRKKDATKTVLEQEAERRKHRRSTDDVWLADDDDSALERVTITEIP